MRGKSRKKAGLPRRLLGTLGILPLMVEVEMFADLSLLRSTHKLCGRFEDKNRFLRQCRRVNDEWQVKLPWRSCVLT